MALTDLTWQLDGGPLLNDDTGLPFTDIEQVTGFDNAPFRETVRDHEMYDGGFMDAQFETGRDIVLQGTVYAQDLNSIEPYLDTLKQNFAPRLSPVPLVFKAAGVNERVIYVKPRGCRYNWDSGYRTGTVSVQFLAYAEDPRFYDNSLQGVSIPLGGPATTGMGFLTYTDGFNRVTASSWGTADSGQTYTLTETGGGTVADFFCGGTNGHISLSVVSGSWYAIASQNGIHPTMYKEVFAPVTALGNPYESDLVERFIDTSNFHYLELRFNTGGGVDLLLVKVVAGVFTVLATTSNVLTGVVPGEKLKARFEMYQLLMNGKVWRDASSEPTWQVTASTDQPPVVGTIGFRGNIAGGNTNTLPIDVKYDNAFGYTGMGFPLSFGVAVPATSTNVTVGGNRPAPAIFTIQGPVTNPRIINLTAGLSLDFNIVLGASDILVVDTLNRTATLNGNVNARNVLARPDWFLLNPGITNIAFGGSGSGTCNCNFRNAWR